MAEAKVEGVLLKKYAHLFGVSSFEELKKLVKDNMQGLTEKERKILNMRLSKSSVREIGPKLNIHLSNVCSWEKKAVYKVLTNLRSRQLQHIGKKQVLSMSLVDLVNYLPYHPSNTHYFSGVRCSFSKLKDLKIYDLVEMGPSIMERANLGKSSYERLRKFLLKEDIKLEKIPPLYDRKVRKYNRVLSTSSLGDIKEVISKYGRLLKPSEFKVLKLRIFDNRSLKSTGMQLGLTRERIRKIEDSALQNLRFYSDRNLENYTKDNILNMKISEFVKLIDLKDPVVTRLKNSLLKRFSDHNLAYLVKNPSELVSTRNFGVKSYKTLKELLKGYDIIIPEVDYFKFVNW